MMNAKSKSLATLAAALTLTSGLAFGGFHYKQVWSPGYETVYWSVPSGANVFWELATYGSDYAYATLGASGPGISISSYVSTTSGPGYDYGEQYTNASGAIDATLHASSSYYLSSAMSLITVHW